MSRSYVNPEAAMYITPLENCKRREIKKGDWNIRRYWPDSILRILSCWLVLLIFSAGSLLAQTEYASSTVWTKEAPGHSDSKTARSSSLGEFGLHGLPHPNLRMSIHLENGTVKEALEIISEEGGLRLAYQQSVFSPETTIDLDLSDVAVLDALYEVMRLANLTLQVTPSGHLIVMRLYETEPLLVTQEQLRSILHPKEMQATTRALPQDFSVSGTVTDADDGEPLAGVNIIVQGTSIGTATGADGSYELTVPSSEDTLVVSYVGYQTVEVPIAGRAVVDVALLPGIDLEDLIVTGYQTQSRRNITGAVSSVDPEDITSIPATTLGDQLQGQVPGVTVQTGGRPGSDARIRIRGLATIGNNKPLIVVDGVATEAGLNEINPRDVESIQVLKDATSASIYGARAASGVIVITTKQGRNLPRPRINVQYYSGIQQPTNLPDLLNTQQYADVLWESMKNAGLNATDPQFGNGDEPVIPDYILPEGAFEGEVDESTYHWENNQIIRTNKEGTDWFDVLFDPAAMHNISLSAAGSGEGSSYYVSGNYLTQSGIVNYTGFDRFMVRANTHVGLADRVTVGENLSVSFTRKNGDPTEGLGFAYSHLPHLPVYDIRGNWAGTKGSGLGPSKNTQATLFNRRYDVGETFRTFGNAFVEIGALDNVVLRSSIGVDYATGTATEWLQRDFWNAESFSNSSFEERRVTDLTWTWTNTVDYHTIINNVHDVEVIAGTETIAATERSLTGKRAGFFSDDVDYRYVGTGNLGIENGGTGSKWALNSIFTKVDYIYNDKYLLSATVRRDGSSRFGQNNRYGVFPAGSVGWRISSEPFMQGAGFLSNLMLRAGWGQTGNQEIGNFAAHSAFGANLETDAYDLTGSNNGVLTGYDLKALGNPDVKWETTSQTNIGLDADFLHGALSFVVDVYRKTTTDMLLQVPQPAQSGQFEFPFINVGSVRNQGIEVAGSYGGIVGDLSYDVGLNVGHNQNEVLQLAGDRAFLDFGPARTQAGNPMSMYYGYVIDGIFQTQEEVETHAAQPEKAVGRWRFRDVDGNGVVNSDDQTFIGNPHPDFVYGFSSRLGFKGFDLSAVLQGSVGNDLWHGVKAGTDFSNFITNRSTRVLDSWTPENQDALLPELNINNPNSEGTKPHTYFVEDGSYLRIKSLQLGYSIPTRFLPGNTAVRLYALAKNLWTLTNYGGIDPEVGGSDVSIGIDGGHYPLAKTYTFGVNVTL